MIPVKSSADIQKMRRACQIAAAALKKGGEAVRPGITTAQLDKIIHQTIVSMGGKPACLGYCGFPAAACISVNDVVIHGIPGGRTLKEGDIVGIDLCVSCDGFIGDNAATFACGNIDPEAQRLLDVTKEALARGIAAAQAGSRIGDISAAVQGWVEENGFSCIRDYTGHGIGREMHEEPEVPNYGKAGHGPRLVPGMTICIEPMVAQKDWKVKVLSDGWTAVTRDGGLAAHFEHTVVITSKGPVILTQP